MTVCVVLLLLSYVGGFAGFDFPEPSENPILSRLSSMTRPYLQEREGKISILACCDAHGGGGGNKTDVAP